MNIAICDDEPEFCRYFSDKISELLHGEETVYRTFTSPLELLECETFFDVVFLDIKMQEFDGIELAKTLIRENSKTIIIFVTNYDNLVFKALSIYPFAFIRKKDISEQLPKVFAKISSSQQAEKHMICFKTPTGEAMLNLHDIMCFTSVGHSVFAVTSGQVKIKIKATLKSLEKSLNDYGFVRCHISYIVNTRYIYSIESDKVLLDDKNEIPLSRYRADDVKKSLMNLMRSM